MNTDDSRASLSLFLASLPDSAFFALRDKNIELQILPLDIASSYGFVLYETGALCEGVLRVLKGEDSASNLVAFIQKDPNIEEDNRQNIPALAYELQTRLFDPVLPILKSAGFPIKEGKVPPAQRIVPTASVETETTSLKPGASPAPSAPALPPIEEKNLNALLRIASGTTYTEADLRSAFESLPVGLRQSLSSVDTANAIQEIAKKYLLHVDQMASLASETGLVLLGLTHPADFIKNLGTRLRLPEDRAKEIARDISSQILVKVREALRGLHEERPKQSTLAPAPNQSSKTQETLRNLNAIPSVGASLPKASTPFSPGAKWNTGEQPDIKARLTSELGILVKQAGEEKQPSRADVLRDVENPRTISSIPRPIAPQLPQAKTMVGPTGWKPAGGDVGKPQVPVSAFQTQNTGTKPSAGPIYPPVQTARNISVTPSAQTSLNTHTGLPKYPINKLEPAPMSAPVPPPQQRPIMPPIPPRAPISSLEKSRPSDADTGRAPIKPADTPQDFLDQKLQTPMSVPKEEKRYTTDPYREPLA